MLPLTTLYPDRLRTVGSFSGQRVQVGRSCSSRAAVAHASAHRRGHQRAPGVPLLPPDVLLLLLAEAALPGQARAVGHAVRVRVLPPEVPHQELADDAQEPAAPRLERHAEAAAEDVGAAQRAGAGAAPPVRAGRARARAAAAARPAMTSAHGLNRCPPPSAPAAPGGKGPHPICAI